jgi:hypothetical protein
MTNCLLKSSIIMLACLSSSCAWSACEESPGSFSCHEEVMQDFNQVGNVQLLNTRIDGVVKVTGAFSATESHFKRLLITGNAKLDGCDISQGSAFTGGLVTSRSSFAKNIKVNSNHAVFSDSKLAGIKIKYRGMDQPRIELRDQTKVTGKIEFVGTMGLVLADKSSEVSGDIVNGELVRQ